MRGSLGWTSRGRTRLAQIEGLRAFAALAVMGTHLALISGFTAANALGPLAARLNVGVALFFVLSAYLLYRPWVEARLNGGREPDARQYAVRRLLRILPAYWFALLVLGILLPDEVPGVFDSRWWAYFGLLQVYSQETIVGGLGVAWSLSTELAFYLVLPLIAWTAAQTLARYRRAVQVRVELVALAASVLLAFAARHVVAREEWLPTFPNTLVGKWPWFAVGLGLAVARAAWGACPMHERPWLVKTAETRAWAWWSVAGVVLLFAAYGGALPRNVFAMTSDEAELETLLFGAFALCLVAPIVLSAASPARGPAALLASPPVAWLGTVSYGIFLWHYPLARWTLSWIPDDARLFAVVALRHDHRLCGRQLVRDRAAADAAEHRQATRRGCPRRGRSERAGPVSVWRPYALRALTMVGAVAICAWLTLSLIQTSAIEDARERIFNRDALTRSEAGEVEAQLDRASPLNPDQTVNILRAGLALRQGRVEQARRTLLQIVHDEPENVEAWAAIAIGFDETDPSVASRARAAIRRLAPPAGRSVE